MAEGDYKLAAQRLVYARDAEPSNTSVLRLMTLAFWQSGDLTAAGRAVRDWARADPDRPAAHRFAARPPGPSRRPPTGTRPPLTGHRPEAGSTASR